MFEYLEEDIIYKNVFKNYRALLIRRDIEETNGFIMLLHRLSQSSVAHEIVFEAKRSDHAQMFVVEVLYKIANDDHTVHLIDCLEDFMIELAPNIKMLVYNCIVNHIVVAKLNYTKPLLKNEGSLNLKAKNDLKIILRSIDGITSSKQFVELMERKMKRKVDTMKIKHVIFNDPATIVFFEDGDKIVVKAMSEDRYQPEMGLAMAYVKKAFGSRSAYQRFVEQWLPEEGEELQNE